MRNARKLNVSGHFIEWRGQDLNLRPSGYEPDENGHMARVLITGSTDGLGLAAARTLVDERHTVVVHARNRARGSDLSDRIRANRDRRPSSADETRDLARQVNEIGRMDAVIHNAGMYVESTVPRRPTATPERSQSTRWRRTCSRRSSTDPSAGRSSSGMHHSGAAGLNDIDWTREGGTGHRRTATANFT